VKSPAELMLDIEAHVAELDRVGKLLDAAMDTYAEAEAQESESKEAYDAAYDDSIAAQIEQASNSDERLPSDNKMEALARVECRTELQTLSRAQRQTKRARRLKEKLEKAASREGNMLNGRQSELSTLRVEASATPAQQPAWSGQAA